MDGFAFRIASARFGLRVSDESVLDAGLTYVPGGAVQSASPVVEGLYSLIKGGNDGRVRRFHLLYIGSKLIARSMDLDEVLEVFRSDIPSRVPVLARRRLFVRATVVKWRGSAIVLPGADGEAVGAALTERGAITLSDEFAVIDGRGRAHPYSVNQLSGQRPAPIRMIALPGAPSAPPATLGKAAALLGLLEYCPVSHLWPRETMPRLRRAIALAEAVEFDPTDPSAAAEQVLDHVRRMRKVTGFRAAAAS